MEHKNRIKQFFHCSQCLEELDKSEDEFKDSPRDFAQIEVGFTKEGFQVWCKRHEINIADFDFMGNKIGVIE